LARHTLDLFGGRKREVGLPGAANNTGDDARVLILSRERRHKDMPNHDWLPASVRAKATDRKLKSGETLFRQGDKPVSFFEVTAGRVRLTRVDRSGREVVLYVAGPGETIAEASLFSTSIIATPSPAPRPRCASIRKPRCSRPSTETARRRRPSPRPWRVR